MSHPSARYAARKQPLRGVSTEEMCEEQIVRVVLCCSRDNVSKPLTVRYEKIRYRPLDSEGIFQHFDTTHEVHFDVLEGATLSL